ncbi:universal stress protein [Nocardia sp. CDC159]|uniref:Universal stress protein n=1 Tax=Nocardia pulmonis TaxID=2951408 RepID=A0A9X2E1Z9_9NOCA|nr:MULTISPECIES: universal stress protein [Nocardia]MCM6772399.1 universal stress protein [Nocardia pulmonis]MCM6784943.1 universal stress protein [Nocardia sp. CDC159]
MSEQAIVAAVDGSSVSYNAAAWAAAEAALHGRRLELVTSVNVPVGWGPGAVMTDIDMDWLRKDGERILAEAARIARLSVSESPEITTTLTFDPIISDLIARSKRAHMIVVGSRGQGALRRGLLGSVSTAVTRHADCPVAVIHSWSAIDPVSADKPVLVGVDGSEYSMPALELAFDEASRRKVGLTALHAWSDVPIGMDVPMMGWDNTVRETEQAAFAESLAGFSERYPEVPVRRILVQDRPVRALVDESDNAQLVVVGSHGRGGFTGMLLGSTSNAVLHSVETPLVIVRRRKTEEETG